MKKMSTYGKGSEDAVSPVIGVILMVAITVILAAVIAAFVFGMAGNVSKTRSVAVTAQKTANTTGTYVVLTNNGGPDNADVTAFNVTINGTVGAPISVNTVGLSKSYQVSPGNRDRVVVTATFQDGTQQVVLDTNV